MLYLCIVLHQLPSTICGKIKIELEVEVIIFMVVDVNLPGTVGAGSRFRRVIGALRVHLISVIVFPTEGKIVERVGKRQEAEAAVVVRSSVNEIPAVMEVGFALTSAVALLPRLALRPMLEVATHRL